MDYSECPNHKCGRQNTTLRVYRCDVCGFEGCWNQYHEGCWDTGQPCPNCGTFGKYRHVGYVTGRDDSGDD